MTHSHNNIRLKIQCLIIVFSVMLFCRIAHANTMIIDISLQGHLFYPSEIIVPANTAFRLRIINQDNTPEEFDSFMLNREKVLFPQRPTIIYLPPLAPGRYPFIGEYSASTAKGVIIVLDSNVMLDEHRPAGTLNLSESKLLQEQKATQFLGDNNVN